MFTASSRQILELLHSGELQIGGANTRAADQNCDTLGSRTHLPILLGFAAIYIIWGSTYLGIRYAVETIPPFFMMGIRHLVAGTLVFAWARTHGAPAPTRKQWRFAVVAGLLLFLGGHGLLAWAEQRVASGLAALLCATLPLWTILVSAWDGSERRLNSKVWAGLGFGFAGVALLIGPDALSQHLNVIGAIAALGSALAWAIGTSYSRRAALPESKILSAAMQMIAGGSTLMIAGAIAGETGSIHLSTLTAKSVLALAYLIVFGSIIAFTVYTWLVSVSNPTMLSTYAYVNPVVAVFLGWMFAGETITPRTIAATMVILGGVLLVTRAKSQPRVDRRPVQSIASDEMCEAAGD
jgi:drug/metabolite transporter (DMT)-like permease